MEKSVDWKMKPVESSEVIIYYMRRSPKDHHMIKNRSENLEVYRNS
jgi:hypothetical protein